MEMVEVIRKQEADYVITVKGNQVALHQQIRAEFGQAQASNFARLGTEEWDEYQSSEEGHGRVERHSYWTLVQPAL